MAFELADFVLLFTFLHIQDLVQEVNSTYWRTKDLIQSLETKAGLRAENEPDSGSWAIPARHADHEPAECLAVS